MTRADVITRLRQHLPRLRPLGITGLSLAGTEGRVEAEPWDDEIGIVFDIDLAAHPKFNMLTLGGIKADLDDELGADVRPLVLDGMPEEFRAQIERDIVRIA